MLCYRKQQAVSICNRFHAKHANVRYRLFIGYSFIAPTCACFLEARGSRLELLKFTFNVKNFISYTGCLGLSLVILAQFAFEMCATAQSRNNKFNEKFVFWYSRSSTVIIFGVNRKHKAHDLLIAINSNLDLIWHRF